MEYFLFHHRLKNNKNNRNHPQQIKQNNQTSDSKEACTTSEINGPHFISKCFLGINNT